MTVPVPAGNHPVSAVVTSPGKAIIAAQVSLASGRANMNNVTGTLPVANGGTGANTASGARENLGIVQMTTAQVDDVMDDNEEVVSDNVVNGTVFTYIWGKIKTWAAAAFAPISHTHTQSNISDLPIDVANGGTGVTTAGEARAYLGDIPQASSDTAAATAAKTATLEGFALFAGARVCVKSQNANTVSGALTLNVNGTGAKSVYVKGAAASSSNALTWSAGDTLELFYDGTNWHYLGLANMQKALESDLASVRESVSQINFTYGTDGSHYYRFTAPNNKELQFGSYNGNLVVRSNESGKWGAWHTVCSLS